MFMALARCWQICPSDQLPKLARGLVRQVAHVVEDVAGSWRNCRCAASGDSLRFDCHGIDLPERTDAFRARHLGDQRPARPRSARKRSCQSPRRDWRNSRIVGYQGLSSRSSSQRQSGEKGNATHTGAASAPARCATAVSDVITRSRFSITAAVSQNAPPASSSLTRQVFDWRRSLRPIARCQIPSAG